MNSRQFNTAEPIAYLFTWTGYGTWLPGDERGWHRWGGGDVRPPSATFKEMAATQLKESEFLLKASDRTIVENTIARHCEIRNWALHAVNARTNHVHVVATTAGYDPKTARDQFKAWCTRNLKPTNPGRERFWTEGGSCRPINDEDGLEKAIVYTLDAQDRKDRDIDD